MTSMNSATYSGYDLSRTSPGGDGHVIFINFIPPPKRIDLMSKVLRSFIPAGIQDCHPFLCKMDDLRRPGKYAVDDANRISNIKFYGKGLLW